MSRAVLLHAVLCAALFVASFCRARLADHTTLPVVRAALCVQATAAAAAGIAPWLWAYRPEWPALALLGSMVLMQGVTSLLWRGGVPVDFRRAAPAPLSNAEAFEQAAARG